MGVSDDADATHPLTDTGERMVPEFHSGVLIYAEHVTRYRSALPLVEGKVVLDVASGSGYGSQMLASAAAHVYGVDVDADATAYSRAHFGAPNVEFITADATAIPLSDASVDVVVTFETIEHIKDQAAFMAEIKRVLRPGGVALISTPNDREFAEGNHFHLHEFEYDELLAFTRGYFAHVESYFQATWKYVAVGPESALTTEGPMGIPTDNLAPLTREQFLYFYLVCSDEPLTRGIAPTAAVGGHYSERAQVTHEEMRQGHIDHLERVNAELETRVTDLDRHVRNLEAERDAARRDLQAILNTRVVRYTKPLRTAYRRVRTKYGPDK
jgi:SAM-dependent methyltransferase